MTERTKRCTKCGVEKSLTEYTKLSRGRDGLRPACKACCRAYNRRYYRANLEAAKMARARYRAENRERVRAMCRDWNQNNCERHRANTNRWAAANRERRRATRAAWAAANRDRHRETTARWARENADRKRDSYERRRARKLAAFVADVDRQTIWVRDKGMCGICGGAADPKRWHLDHVIPLSRGGTHEPANVQVSHPFCNLSKGAMLMHERTRETAEALSHE